jgi:hypothetical protein
VTASGIDETRFVLTSFRLGYFRSGARGPPRLNYSSRAIAGLRDRREVEYLTEIRTITSVYRLYRHNIFPLWPVDYYFELR